MAFIAILAAMGGLASCSGPEYDTSTPQATLDAMHKMIVQGRPEMLADVLHIEPRPITYSDGVTEASAIQEVLAKAGNMLGQLYRVAGKLRDRFPAEIDAALAAGRTEPQRRNFEFISRFMADPFGLTDQHRQRVTVEDLGDGTAAILIDGQPAFGIGMQMRQIDGGWKVDLPIELMQRFRPNTRQEWSVVANILLSIERSLEAFESELDQGQFRDLQQASNRAGRLLGERVLIQAMIYQRMKTSLAAPDEKES